MIWFDRIFFFLIALVFYTYLGYGFTLYLLVIFKRFFVRKETGSDTYIPQVCLMIAAYNEEAIIRDKIINSLSLNYPRNKPDIIVVTDGSDDKTPDIVRGFSEVRLLHEPIRRGKIAAVERAMEIADGDVVIFSDANTFVNKEAIEKLVRHFQDSKVGAVAGEKRILTRDKDQASAAGEGLYWKYESLLKKWDSEFNTVVGAAGELFAIRRDLYEKIPQDTLIEDFYMTLKIAQKGYKVVYEPEAFAVEEPTTSIKQELKRKTRIAAGGLQAIFRLTSLLNFFRYGWLTFQYVSHRVLRWTLAPISLPLIFILNVVLLQKGFFIYQFIFAFQVLFYLLAGIGFLLEKKKIKLKPFFIPFYFCVMNYAVFAGMWKLINGKQSVVWDKAERRTT